MGPGTWLFWWHLLLSDKFPPKGSGFFKKKNILFSSWFYLAAVSEDLIGLEAQLRWPLTGLQLMQALLAGGLAEAVDWSTTGSFCSMATEESGISHILAAPQSPTLLQSSTASILRERGRTAWSFMT